MEDQEVDVSAGGQDWLKCTAATGVRPTGRYACTATLVDGAHVLIFGGSAADGSFCEDLAVWSVGRGSFVEPRSGVLEKSGRGHHAACERNGALWVFGGKANGYKNDLHCYESGGEHGGWRRVTAEGKAAPEPRYGMASCVVGDEWLIHGGYDSDASVCGDLWSFSFASRTWTKKQQIGTVPVARMNHTLVAVGGGKAVLWGGKDGKGGCPATIYVLDVNSGAWSELKSSKLIMPKRGKKSRGAPCVRWGHSACLLQQREGSFIVIFGGRDKDAVYNDAWLLSVSDGSWQLLDAAFAPAPRALHAAVMMGEQLLVFGGMNLETHAFDTLFKVDVTRQCYISKVDWFCF